MSSSQFANHIMQNKKDHSFRLWSSKRLCSAPSVPDGLRKQDLSLRTRRLQSKEKQQKSRGYFRRRREVLKHLSGRHSTSVTEDEPESALLHKITVVSLRLKL